MHSRRKRQNPSHTENDMTSESEGEHSSGTNNIRANNNVIINGGNNSIGNIGNSRENSNCDERERERERCVEIIMNCYEGNQYLDVEHDDNMKQNMAMYTRGKIFKKLKFCLGEGYKCTRNMHPAKRHKKEMLRKEYGKLHDRADILMDGYAKDFLDHFLKDSNDLEQRALFWKTYNSIVIKTIRDLRAIKMKDIKNILKRGVLQEFFIKLYY